MAIPLDEILRKLPADEQEAIERRSRELIAKYLTLQDLRKARELTQERMAELLGIKQENERLAPGEAHRPAALDVAELCRRHGRAPTARGRVPRPAASRPFRPWV